MFYATYAFLWIILKVSRLSGASTDLGCYIENEGDTLKILPTKVVAIASPLSATQCVAKCRESKHFYAGIIDMECRCGFNVPSSLSKTLPEEGSTCSKLIRSVRIYSTSLNKKGRITVSAKHLGCYRDIFSKHQYQSKLNATIRHALSQTRMRIHEQCHLKCFEEGYLYAGIKNGICVCDDYQVREEYRVLTPNANCDDTNDDHIEVYATGITDEPRAKFEGCYNEQFAVKLKSGLSFSLNRTNSPRRCANICFLNGFRYATLQSGSCFCSQQGATDDSLIEYGRCTLVKCAGDESETCGGPDVLKTYSTEYTELKPYQDVYGCFENDVRNPLMGLTQHKFPNDSSVTGDTCAELCKLRGFAFAGISGGQDCYCSHNAPPSVTKLTGLDCESPCGDDTPNECGDKRPLFVMTSGLPIQDIIASAYIGCYKEGNNNKNISTSRLLGGYFYNYFESLSPRLCHYICYNEGMLYFGLTEGSECFCGDQQPDPDSILSDSLCDKPCSGNANYKCGGTSHTSIYSTGITNIPARGRYKGCYAVADGVLDTYKADLTRTCSPRRCLNICDIRRYKYAAVYNGRYCRCGNTLPTDDLKSADGDCGVLVCIGSFGDTCGSAESMAVYGTTHQDDEASSVSENRGYLGCFLDYPGKRILKDVKEEYGNSLTPSYCTSICMHRGFAFAGLTEGSECYCGYNRPTALSKVNDTQCNKPCLGSVDVFCGGESKTAIYATDLKTVDIESSIYLGCYKENEEIKAKNRFLNRLVFGFWQTIGYLTVENCHHICHNEGYLYFGLTDKFYCFCGDQRLSLKSKVAEVECSGTCEGNVRSKCGASSRFSVYFTGITDYNTVGTYFGCYKDSKEEPLLPDFKTSIPSVNSVLRCSNICAQKDFQFSGVKSGSECLCGNIGPNSTVSESEEACEVYKCPGSSNNERCGSDTNVRIHRVIKISEADKTCRSKGTCPTTTSRPMDRKTTAIAIPSVTSPPPANSCQVPEKINGRSCKVVGCFDGSSAPGCSGPGSFVPGNAEALDCWCDSGYTFVSVTNRSICYAGKWYPPVPECAKLCLPLKSNTVDVTSCELKGEPVLCSSAVQPGTVARVQCKNGYLAENFALAVRSVTCGFDGFWDRPLHKCRPGCGEGFPGVKPLLTGGQVAKRNDAPWHVAIYRNRKEQPHAYICGGSIVTPILILTAAHCFYDPDTNKRINAEEFEVGVGKVFRDYYALETPRTKIFGVKNLFIPSSYFGAESLYAADIAILELDDIITISSLITPVCMDLTNKDNPPHAYGKIVGWGAVENGSLSDTLLTVDLPYLSQTDCRHLVSETFRAFVSLPDKFCAGSKEGPGARSGDSGSGLTFKQGGQYFVYGVVSFKETVNTSVAAFTRVSSYIDWYDNVRKQVEARTGV